MAADDPTVTSDRPVGRVSFQQIKVIFAFAAAVALGLAAVFWSLRPDYVPVFNERQSGDAGPLTDILQQNNIPYRLEDGTGLILVPQDRVRQARRELAGGVAGDASAGYEFLQREQSIWTSQFLQQARYQHALETELARTISEMAAIESARVHLAVPKQSAFVREQPRPSASVMLKLSPEGLLEDGQVSSIVHLVAASIPHMEASRVTVVDQRGRMLTARGAVSEMQRRHLVQQLERAYADRIEMALRPALAPGRVEAEVRIEADTAADVDAEGAGIAAADIRRLTAAVVLDPGDDKAAVSDSSLARYRRQIQEAIPFRAERGDRIEIVRAPPTGKPDAGQAAAWRDFIKPVAAAVMVLVIVFGLLRPALKSLSTSSPGRTATASRRGRPSPADSPGMAGGESERPPVLPAIEGKLADELKTLTRRDPEAVIGVTRQWLAEHRNRPDRLPQAALLLILLGEARAAEVLKALQPDEVRTLGRGMKMLNDIEPAQIEALLSSFRESLDTKGHGAAGVGSYFKRVLEQSVGADRARRVMSDAAALDPGLRSLEVLRWWPPESIRELLDPEHPQVIAILLACLDPEQSARVVAVLPDDLRTDVVARIASIEAIQATTLHELDAMLQARLEAGARDRSDVVGGLDTAAAIVRGLPEELEASVLERIGRANAGLRQSLEAGMEADSGGRRP